LLDFAAARREYAAQVGHAGLGPVVMAPSEASAAGLDADVQAARAAALSDYDALRSEYVGGTAPATGDALTPNPITFGPQEQ
jgi:hypothetical protein